MMTSFDFIGDIHGHYEELRALLKKLGYVESANTFRYPGNERRVIFLGDYIDRGPNVRNTLNLVRSMRDSGSAIALMGNHEFNMLSFWQKNGGGGGHFLKKMKDGYLRAHSFNKVAVHSRTVADFVGRKDEFLDFLDFAKTLPFYLEEDSFRAQHASFDFKAVEILKAQGIQSFSDGNFHELIARANDEDCEFEDSLFYPFDVLLKGPEMELPNPLFFYDGEGVRRTRARIRWWVDPAKANLEELSFQPGVNMPFSFDIDEKIRRRPFYGENERPVFFGHYWLTGEPRLIRHNVCCLDFSIARHLGNGRLAAYRFDGEQKLDDRKFVWVEAASRG
ncbi:MAG: metallophosphoesterase [Fibrobacter sp.]|nr:metallophosphoesterase [Fibrobacter sp.]